MLLRTKLVAMATTAIIGATTVGGTIAYLNEKPLNDAMAKNITATTDATKEMGQAEIVIGKLISTKTSEINELNTKINSLENQLKISKGNNSNLESEIETLKSDKASNEETIKQLNQKISDIKTNLDNVTNKTKNYKEAFNTEKNEVVNANNYITKEAEELNTQTNKLNQTRENLDVSIKYAIDNENLGLK